MKIERANPLASNPGAPVVAASMADQIKPDTEGLAPPGHTRNEQMKSRLDRLEEQIGQMPVMSGGIDVSHIPLENEVVEKFDRQGNLPVSHWDRTKWMVKWKLAKEISMMISEDEGWEVVSGDPRPGGGANPDNPDNWMGIEYIGRGPANGGTLRGHVDVLLVRMPLERYMRMEEDRREKQRALGQVTERFEDYGEELAQRGLYPSGLTHGRADDPLIRRVFANGPLQAQRMTRVLQEGSLPGARADQIFGGRR